MEIDKMSKGELWKEIIDIVNSTHFTETDKALLIKMISDYSLK